MAKDSRTVGLFADSTTGTHAFLSHPDLGGQIYDLEGMIELPIGKPKRGKGKKAEPAAPQAFVNLSATARAAGPRGLPHRFQIVSSDHGKGVIDHGGKKARSTARLPVAIVYDDLDVTEGFYPEESPAEPTRFQTELHLSFSLIAGDWRLGGTIPPVGLPKDAQERVPIEIFGGIEIADGPVCNTVCVRIWSKTRNVNEAKADQIIDCVNGIWGCSGGQCCIKLVKKRYSTQTTMSAKPLIRRGVMRDHLDIIGSLVRDTGHRSKRCFDLYFTDRIRTSLDPAEDGPLGGTSHHSGRNFVLVSTESAAGATFSDAALCFTVAHELGHVLGLARTAGTGPRGVRRHSSSGQNLMQPSVNPGLTPAGFRRRARLNRHQCEAARRSGLVQPTREPCRAAAREAEPV